MTEPEHRQRPAHRPEDIPLTAVRLLPVLIATFGVSWLIDVGTDWPSGVRWILAIAAGMAAGAVAVGLWTRGRTRP